MLIPNEQNTLIGIWIILIIILVIVIAIIAMLINMSRHEWKSVEDQRRKARVDKIISD